jgi:hypothetical protein
MSTTRNYRHLLSPAFGLTLTLALLTSLTTIDISAQTKKRTRKSVRRSAATTTANAAEPGIAPLRIARNTEMKIRLESTIDTKEARDGDNFTATVLSPSEYEGATVDGHVASIKKSGKFKGQTGLSLAFDKITLKDGRSTVMDAQVVRVYDNESAKKVDEEGTVKSGGQGETTLKRSGIGAAGGALIGAIAGGGKGAAIGAIVGGAAGAGSVYVLGTNKVKLERGTDLLIQTTR